MTATIRAEQVGPTLWLGPWTWVDGYHVRYYLDRGRPWCVRVPALASTARPARPLVAAPKYGGFIHPSAIQYPPDDLPRRTR